MKQRKQRSGQLKVGPIYRALLKVFGPAQVGPYDEPAREKPPPDVACAQCGQPMSAHAIVRTPQKSRTQCPRPGVAGEQQ